MVGLQVLGRASLSLCITVSWLLTSTHCVFAALADPPAVVSQPQQDVQECPMHARSKPAPQRNKTKNGCTELPCCKNLPAAKPNGSTSAIKPVFGIEQTNWLVSDTFQLEVAAFP